MLTTYTNSSTLVGRNKGWNRKPECYRKQRCVREAFIVWNNEIMMKVLKYGQNSNSIIIIMLLLLTRSRDAKSK